MQYSDSIDFLTGNLGIKPFKKITIENVWNYSNMQLELNHSYIQWLFPLEEASLFNPFAPVLTKEDIAFIQNSYECKQSLKHSLSVMLKFYGFLLSDVDKEIQITPSNECQERLYFWWNPGNHNHLRVTRILKSLTILGLPEYAKAFYKVLKNLYATNNASEVISEETFQFWTNAISIDEKE